MIAIGDRVVVRLGSEALDGIVLDFEVWSWMLVQTADGRLWLEVVMNVSAVSWTQLVLLEADVPAQDRARVTAIADAVAWYPNRKDVADVEGAAVFCGQHDQIRVLSG